MKKASVERELEIEFVRIRKSKNVCVQFHGSN